MKSELNQIKQMLLKVIKRYLTPIEYKELINDLISHKRITNPIFVLVMKRHFNIERWRTAPLIWQDVWLYNYFQYEFKGRVGMTGLLKKYAEVVFLDDEILFFTKREETNKINTPLPMGVIFTPNEGIQDIGEAANHLLSAHLEPTAPKPNLDFKS